ncbi:hypothetical protein BaRGS_00015637 [Batillaria attramentaria]|uniref:Secreted protein n=1 Tax=Batillaria attramentaria TaxID=370345 RepID=A0ABD0L1J1_9CAEN
MRKVCSLAASMAAALLFIRRFSVWQLPSFTHHLPPLCVCPWGNCSANKFRILLDMRPLFQTGSTRYAHTDLRRYSSCPAALWLFWNPLHVFIRPVTSCRFAVLVLGSRQVHSILPQMLCGCLDTVLCQFCFWSMVYVNIFVFLFAS